MVKFQFWSKNIVPPPPKKSFAISRGSVTVIGVFKNEAKQKFGEIVSIFREL